MRRQAPFHKLAIRWFALSMASWFCTPAANAADAKKPNYLLGGQSGLVFYSSPALVAMNKRLGNSVALTQAYEFGRARSNGGYIARRWRDSTSIAFTFDTFSESLSGSNNTNYPLSGSSSLSFFQYMAWGSVRFYPFPDLGDAGGFKWVRLKQGGSSRRSGPPKLYFIMGLGLGGLNSSHSYDLSDESEGTKVKYKWSAMHLAYGPTAKFNYRLGEIADVFLDGHYIFTSPLSHSTLVTDYVVKEQNNLYNHESLKLSSMASSPYTLLQVRLGINVMIGPMAKKRGP